MNDKSQQEEEGNSNRLKCSFCGKQQKQVQKLIAGPGVYICEDCVWLCNEILDDEGIVSEATKSAKPPALTLKERQNLDATVWSSTLTKIQILSSDQWRGKKLTDKDSTEAALVAVATLSLEELLQYYLDSSVKAGAEPLLRALLHLKERLVGNVSPELVPLLEQLIVFYTESKEYFLAASLLEWLLEIGHVSQYQLIEEKTHRQYALNLVKLYIRLGRTEEADILLDSLS